jgi:hypothetical protein
MTTPVVLRMQQTPPGYKVPGSPIRWLIEMATNRPTVVTEDPRRHVDVEVRSTAYSRRYLAMNTLRRGSRVIIPRIGDRLVRPGDLKQAPPPERLAKYSLWFTGENIRPPAEDWDLMLSFDLDPMDARNLYFPLWWESIGAMGNATFDFAGRPLPLASWLEPREPESRRPKFACAFIGNPTPTRFRAIAALSALGQVDVFGRAVGRPVGNQDEVAKEYRYRVCFENDLYPGYVTEKVFDAWRCGNIPLWWGLDPAGYLNNDALLNLASMQGVAELVERVADVERTFSVAQGIQAAPLLVRAPDIGGAITRLASTLPNLVHVT